MFDCPFLFASALSLSASRMVFVFVLDMAGIQEGRNLLGAQGEGGTGDARRQMQPLDDLLPQLLVDNIHQAAAGYHQIVQLVQVQHRLGHDRQPIDRRACE